jgi:hypothetical protein
MNDQQRRDFIKLFESVGQLHQTRFVVPLWNHYPKAHDNQWDSLGVFLVGYAFERQGRSPDFSAIAAEIISEMRQFPLDAVEVWQRFCKKRENKGLNIKCNPLAPTSSHSTGRSAIEFANSIDAPLVRWVLSGLQEDRTKEIHTELCKITGVGPKIASFFLRDTAFICQAFPSDSRILDSRGLLQPIDIWVERAATLLGDTEGNPAIFIVDQARREKCSPERMNQGMWYFGAIIAGSKYLLEHILTNPEGAKLAQNLFEEHVANLSKAASCIDSSTPRPIM